MPIQVVAAHEIARALAAFEDVAHAWVVVVVVVVVVVTVVTVVTTVTAVAAAATATVAAAMVVVACVSMRERAPASGRAGVR